MKNQDFDSFVQESQAIKQRSISENIRTAYRELKATNWEKIDTLLTAIPKDCFEYYEISFLRAHHISTYQNLGKTVFANSYKLELLEKLRAMISLCSPHDKNYYTSLYEDYKSQLEQFQHDMEVKNALNELYQKKNWVECGKLLEKEIRENPSNIVWYIYMADVKCKINPSYDCNYETSCFKKYFNRKKDIKKYQLEYYECYERDTPNSESYLIRRMMQSWFAYSYKFSSLLLLPFTMIAGFCSGLVLLFIVGGAFVLCAAILMEIYHIYQIFTLTKRQMFKKVLLSQGERPILFAQWAYFIKVKESWHCLESLFDGCFPFELLGAKYYWSLNWNCFH